MYRPISALALVITVLALTLGTASPAGAHVTVSSSTTEPGAWATLTFTVPTESDTAGTTGLTVHLPADAPFTSVLTQPMPGWTVRTTRTELPAPVRDGDGDPVTSAVTTVKWTADAGGGIAPGQFDVFTLSVGPLPGGGTLYLPAVQHYSDGTDIDWVQQAEGAADPEQPAPSIVITAAHPVLASPSRPTGRPGLGSVLPGLAIAALSVAVSAAALVRARR